MDYILVNFSAGDKLGISLIARKEGPAIGTAEVNSVESGGIAAAKGVLPGDCIFSIDDVYVGFESYNDIIMKLQSLSPQQIYFVRVTPNKWLDICNNPDATILDGYLDKAQEGFFNKHYSSRFFVLSRKSLHYETNGHSRKSFSIADGQVCRPVSLNGTTKREASFTINCSGKDVSLSTKSLHEKNVWIHSIQCALKRSWDEPFSIATYSRPPEPMAAADIGANDYLKLGRSGLVGHKQAKSTYGQVDPRGNPRLNSSFRQTSFVEATLIEKLQSLSKVTAHQGPLDPISLSGVIDPTSVELSLGDYDFKLEKEIIQESEEK